ncbi:VOC family protein [Paracoccus sp. Z330]|uniref:VOC family protein n=1 Tax=Paracoccus onchidii TaxID=3017813 RepID=A0ABT4ZCM1_9RHOB|nr:VOC family protein [Paracoccus onchidii]MDB6177118.1 VOC family protein [Paracoccus onchidii]
MTNVLGIDHPLIAVRDMDQARRNYEALGFAFRPRSQHPWGTSTSLAVFRRQLLELVSIGDDGLLDAHGAGQFRFGRHVAGHLAQREGIALTALYSDDAASDANDVQSRGGHCDGLIRFGRDVLTRDGKKDRTATTLAVFRREGLDRLAMFACQQHRRDLIEHVDWMQHPNGVYRIASGTIMAPQNRIAEVCDWLRVVHGTLAEPMPWGYRVPTGNGCWHVTDYAGAVRLLGVVPPELGAGGGPAILSIDFACRDLGRVRPFLETGGFTFHAVENRLVLTRTPRLGGVMPIFQEG